MNGRDGQIRTDEGGYPVDLQSTTLGHLGYIAVMRTKVNERRIESEWKRATAHAVYPCPIRLCPCASGRKRIPPGSLAAQAERLHAHGASPFPRVGQGVGAEAQPNWSGQRGSNPSSSAWKAVALPIELCPHGFCEVHPGTEPGHFALVC